MTNNPKKEIRISCDFETNTAIVRIFKYRNYTWSGGQVFELKRDCDRLKELGQIVLKYRDEKSENKVWSNRSIIWNDVDLVAVGYNVDMSGNAGKEKHDGEYYLGRDTEKKEEIS